MGEVRRVRAGTRPGRSEHPAPALCAAACWTVTGSEEAKQLFGKSFAKHNFSLQIQHLIIQQQLSSGRPFKSLAADRSLWGCALSGDLGRAA